MSEPVKFTPEELKEIQDIQGNYFNIQGDLGRVSITKLRLDQQVDNLAEKEETLHKSFIQAQADEKAFMDKISKKYGDGVLDPETGTFTPSDKK